MRPPRAKAPISAPPSRRLQQPCCVPRAFGPMKPMSENETPEPGARRRKPSVIRGRLHRRHRRRRTRESRRWSRASGQVTMSSTRCSQTRAVRGIACSVRARCLLARPIFAPRRRLDRAMSTRDKCSGRWRRRCADGRCAESSAMTRRDPENSSHRRKPSVLALNKVTVSAKRTARLAADSNARLDFGATFMISPSKERPSTTPGSSRAQLRPVLAFPAETFRYPRAPLAARSPRKLYSPPSGVPTPRRRRRMADRKDGSARIEQTYSSNARPAIYRARVCVARHQGNFHGARKELAAARAPRASVPPRKSGGWGNDRTLRQHGSDFRRVRRRDPHSLPHAGRIAAVAPHPRSSPLFILRKPRDAHYHFRLEPAKKMIGLPGVEGREPRNSEVRSWSCLAQNGAARRRDQHICGMGTPSRHRDRAGHDNLSDIAPPRLIGLVTQTLKTVRTVWRPELQPWPPSKGTPRSSIRAAHYPCGTRRTARS